MARLGLFLILASGTMLIFYLGGLLSESVSANSTLLNLLLNPEDVELSDVFSNIFTALSVLGVGAAISAAIILRDPMIAANVAVGIYMFNLLVDSFAIYGVLSEANPVLALILFSPMVLLLLLTSVEWIRGIEQ